MKAIDREENTGLADEDRHWYECPRAQHAAYGVQYAAQQANTRHYNLQHAALQLATRDMRMADGGWRLLRAGLYTV